MMNAKNTLGNKLMVNGWLLLSVTVLYLGQSAFGQAPTTGVTSPAPEVLPEGIEKFVVASKSKDNPQIPFYVRIPSKYREHPDKALHRVLFSCPVYNWDGLKHLSGTHFASLADERGWFIVTPTFKQKGEDVHDRKNSYYYPEVFSGKAVLDALDAIQKKFPIATNGLLLHGFSGGAQFVHRFAIWAPDRVAAVVVNSASWFDSPNEQSQTMGWLVTIGEADPSYENTLEFTAKLREAGALPIFRSYIGVTHELNDKIPELDKSFLRFYDDLTRPKLGAKRGLYVPKPEPILPVSKMPFVGDSQRWKYYPNTPEVLEEIADDERVYFPAEALAQAWGSLEESEK